MCGDANIDDFAHACLSGTTNHCPTSRVEAFRCLEKALEGSKMRIEELAAQSCEPCEGTTPLSLEDTKRMVQSLPGWNLVNNVGIDKEFRFRAYRDGLEFAYAVGRLAEEQDHHPDIFVGWRRVRLTFSTHVIKGLSQNDFIMAAKSEIEYQKFAGM